MQYIRNLEFSGERPLYRMHDLKLENIVVHEGESAIKEVHAIEAQHCIFEGKYPFWEAKDIRISQCHFAAGARAALWFVQRLSMEKTQVEAPKSLRESASVILSDCHFTNAAETLWHCSDVVMSNVKAAGADYLGLHSDHITIDGYTHTGNYAFQYCHDLTIRRANITGRDAFWNSEDILVEDSTLAGDFLAWYSNKLTLRRCKILGSQPLCYARGLILEDCTMEDTDLAFEYSDGYAKILGNIPSVKNPTSGSIRADAIGELIIDTNIKEPANCHIESGDKVLRP